MKGTTKESSFLSNDIPVNVDSKKNPVIRTNDISRENRYSAKILASVVQIRERRKLVNMKRLQNYKTTTRRSYMILNEMKYVFSSWERTIILLKIVTHF